MRRRSWTFPFVLAAVLAYAFMATNGTAKGAGGDVLAPKLTRVVATITGENVRVFCHQFGDMTAGEAQRFEDGSVWIGIAPDGCVALRRMVAAPPYPRMSSGEAVFTLAHEGGHALGMALESKADCYASRTWKRYALAVGFRKAQLPALKAQLHGGCWH